jgi:spore germination protein KB
MIEKGKINVRQFTVLVIMFSIGSTILIVPSELASGAKQDAWIAACSGLLGGLLLVMLYNRISSLFPNTSFVHYTQLVLGKWLGGLVSFLYFNYFLLLSAFVLRDIGEFLTTEVLPTTPIHVIHILFLVVIIMGIRNGIEVPARSAEIFLPWAAFFFIMMVIFLPPQFDWGYIKPILGYGIKPVIRGSLSILAIPYFELFIFLLIFPLVSHHQQARKAFLVGVTISGMMLIIMSLLSILVLGADFTSKLLYPSFELAQKISIGHFVERLEIIAAGMWIITIYFKLAICFYATTMTFSELFRLKDARQLYYPFGMIIIVLSIVVFPNITDFMFFSPRIDFFYSMTYALVFPLLILIVAMIRKKRTS